MKKKILADIRLYKSDPQNGYGPTAFADKKLNAAVKRVVMKLRENSFSLGEFDHLYINFTLCPPEEGMKLSQEVDRYHPWYRYCTVPVEQAFYDRIGSPDAHEGILHLIGTVLSALFAAEDFDGQRILSCVQQAAQQGEEMLMKFKEKTGTKRRAVVFLRYLDTCRYAPLLRVYDLEEQLLLEKDLPKSLTLDELGEIQVSAKRVTIKPRKNAFTGGKKPLVFEY